MSSSEDDSESMSIVPSTDVNVISLQAFFISISPYTLLALIVADVADMLVGGTAELVYDVGAAVNVTNLKLPDKFKTKVFGCIAGCKISGNNFLVGGDVKNYKNYNKLN